MLKASLGICTAGYEVVEGTFGGVNNVERGILGALESEETWLVVSPHNIHYHNIPQSVSHLEHATHDILDVVSLHVPRNELQQTPDSLKEHVLHLVARAEVLGRRPDEVDRAAEVGRRHGPNVI